MNFESTCIIAHNDQRQPLSQKYYHYYDILNETFYSLVPCILIFFFNLTIMFKLLITKFRSKQSNQTSAISKNAMNTTLLLLSVSISFLILTSLVAINYLIFLYYYAIQEITYLSTFLYYTNHSCNAVLYTMVSPKFRKHR